MDIRTYISSGIIESYLLGLATEAEAQELEDYAARYPEVREAIEDQRLALESYTASLTVKPPEDLKEKLWGLLQAENLESAVEPPTGNNVPQAMTLKRRPFFTSWWAAASVILFIGSMIVNFVLWRQQQAADKSIEAMKRVQEQQNRDLSVKENVILAYQQYMKLASDTNTVTVTMKGVGNHTSNTAAILWNKETKEVFLSHNNLPQAPAGKQYQLWAIVDGKPVDAGVFDAGQEKLLIPMKTTARAEMFAVTLEPSGGSIAPTLDQMYVAGKI